MRRATVVLASLAVVFAMAPSAAFAAPSSDTWIVTLRAGDPAESARSLVRTHGGEVRHVYSHALRGFAFRGSAAAANAMLANPNVTRVEADAEVWLDTTTQENATWGIDRIDQPQLPLSETYSYDTTGAGVTAYVIDSGINYTHSEFSGRAVFGADFIGDGQNGDDCNGHGTHVSGTIGGTTYGVAKGVTLVSVRVFGCSGGSAWSTIIAGIDWVVGDHAAGEPAVANMSLGGGANSSVDDAVRKLIGDGVATAVAAGNGNFFGRQDDACKYSPARVAEAMTISATDRTDTKASWANYGTCVDWFAPGVGVTSAWHDSDSSTNVISGTSMATPHTAGVAALYLAGTANATPQQVRDAIFAARTKDIVGSSNTANNDLLYSGFLITGPGGGETEPATGSLSGIVSDSASTSGIAGASVTVSNGSFSASTTTGANGSYAFADVPEGTDYTVTAEATGYQSAEETAVQISAAARATVDFSLTASSGEPITFGVTLASSSTSQGNTWIAIVAITATDSTGKPVDGVTVSGSWGNGATGSASCTTGNPNPETGVTDGTGKCTVSLSRIHKRTGSVTFTVTGVSPSEAFNGSMPSTTVAKP